MKTPNPAQKQLATALQQKSESVNLFSTGDRSKLLEKHIPDAVALLDWTTPSGRILDLGTGGGLPGLALAQVLPDAEFVLLDARDKKLQAVKEVSDDLGLKNVTVLHGRCEDLGHEDEWRESFDVVIARAVAALPTLLEYVSPFLKEDGLFYAWKSQDYKEELEDARSAQTELALEFEDSFDYVLPTGEGRSLLAFRKVGQVDASIPRAVGKAKSNPL